MEKVGISSPFTLAFVSKVRSELLSSVSLYNKTLNKTTTPTVDFYDCDYYQEVSITHTIAEGEQYEFTVTDIDGNEAYKGTFYASDKESLHDNKYHTRTPAKEYHTR